MSDKLSAATSPRRASEAAAKRSVEIKIYVLPDQDHKIRGLGEWRHLDDPFFTQTSTPTALENMSVRSGDKCLTGIKAWATICPYNLNLSYFLAEEGPFA
jgi:hypothetical protein